MTAAHPMPRCSLAALQTLAIPACSQALRTSPVPPGSTASACYSADCESVGQSDSASEPESECYLEAGSKSATDDAEREPGDYCQSHCEAGDCAVHNCNKRMRSPDAHWAAAAPGGTAEHGAHATAATAAAATAKQEQDCAGGSNTPWLREHEHVHYFDSACCRFSRAKVIDCCVGGNGIHVYALKSTDGRVQHVAAEQVHLVAQQRGSKASPVPPQLKPANVLLRSAVVRHNARSREQYKIQHGRHSCAHG